MRYMEPAAAYQGGATFDNNIIINDNNIINVPNALDIDMLHDVNDYDYDATYDTDNGRTVKHANTLPTDEDDDDNDDNRTGNQPILIADEIWNKIDIEVKEHEGGAYEFTCVPYDHDEI